MKNFPILIIFITAWIFICFSQANNIEEWLEEESLGQEVHDDSYQSSFNDNTFESMTWWLHYTYVCSCVQ